MYIHVLHAHAMAPAKDFVNECMVVIWGHVLHSTGQNQHLMKPTGATLLQTNKVRAELHVQCHANLQYAQKQNHDQSPSTFRVQSFTVLFFCDWREKRKIKNFNLCHEIKFNMRKFIATKTANNYLFT